MSSATPKRPARSARTAAAAAIRQQATPVKLSIEANQYAPRAGSRSVAVKRTRRVEASKRATQKSRSAQVNRRRNVVSSESAGSASALQLDFPVEEVEPMFVPPEDGLEAHIPDIPLPEGQELKTERLARTAKACHTLDDLAHRKVDFIGVDLDKVKDPLTGQYDALRNQRAIRKEPYTWDSLNAHLDSGLLSLGGATDGEPSDKVCMWMTTEPQQGLDPKNKQNVVEIPVLFAMRIAACLAPPELVAVASIQSGKEPEPVPMRQYGYSWNVYIPDALRHLGPEELPSEGRLHLLEFQPRPTFLHNLVEGANSSDVRRQQAFHNFALLHPYELFPQIFEESTLGELKLQVRQVSFPYTITCGPMQGETITIDWDKDTDTLTYDRDWRCEDYMGHTEGTPEFEQEKDNLESALRTAFDTKRAAVEASYNAKKDRLEARTQEQRDALRNVKIYKFYPDYPHEVRLHQDDGTVNRFFPKANAVFPALTAEEKTKADSIRQTLEQQVGESTNGAKTVAKFAAPTLPAVSVVGSTGPVVTKTPMTFGGFAVPAKAAGGLESAGTQAATTSFKFGAGAGTGAVASVGANSGASTAVAGFQFKPSTS